MNRQQFKQRILKAVEDFDASIDEFPNFPEQLPFEEWLEQFGIYCETITE